MLRIFSRIVLATIFTILVFGAAPPQDGTQANPYLLVNTQTVSLVWDKIPAQDPSVTRIEIEVRNETGVLVMAFSADKVTWDMSLPDGNKVVVRTHAQDLSNGLYQMRARFVDDYENVSDWSESRWFRKYWTTYLPPGGCRFMR